MSNVSTPSAKGSFELNRLNWEDRLAGHLQSEFYDIDGFRAGRDVLGPIEAAEIGHVSGQRVLHLQCHFGLDTLSLARRGARITGLDFSGKAIAAARLIAQQEGIEASFIEGNVFDAPDLAGAGKWDLVFTTWGTVTWLPDIVRWGRVVAELLTPGGRLYFLDAHPVALALHQVSPDGSIEPAYDYFHGPAPLEFEEETSYAQSESSLSHARTHQWIHPLSAMMMALMDAGLRITAVREHDAIAWQLFPSMARGDDGLWRLPASVPRIPIALTIEAEKAAE